MLKYSLILTLLFILTPSSGCQGPEATLKAPLDREFSLSMGQTAAIQGEQLRITFVEIQDDSRCPRGATCIWQGRVSAVVQAADGTDSARITLTEPGLSDQYGRGTYKKYEFTSHVQPYPELGKKIESGDYRVFLTVKKTL